MNTFLLEKNQTFFHNSVLELTIEEQKNNAYCVKMANARMHERFSLRWPKMVLTEREIFNFLEELETELNQSTTEQFYIFSIFGTTFTAKLSSWHGVLRVDLFSAIPAVATFYSPNGYFMKLGKPASGATFGEFKTIGKYLLLDWLEGKSWPVLERVGWQNSLCCA